MSQLGQRPTDIWDWWLRGLTGLTAELQILVNMGKEPTDEQLTRLRETVTILERIADQ